MDELAPSYIDADVVRLPPGQIEEEQVTGLEVFDRNRLRLALEGAGGMRQTIDPGLRVAEVNETAAVEAVR